MMPIRTRLEPEGLIWRVFLNTLGARPSSRRASPSSSARRGAPDRRVPGEGRRRHKEMKFEAARHRSSQQERVDSQPKHSLPGDVHGAERAGTGRRRRGGQPQRGLRTAARPHRIEDVAKFESVPRLQDSPAVGLVSEVRPISLDRDIGKCRMAAHLVTLTRRIGGLARGAPRYLPLLRRRDGTLPGGWNTPGATTPESRVMSSSLSPPRSR